MPATPTIGYIIRHLDQYLARLDDLDDETLALVFEASCLRDASQEQPSFDKIIDDSVAEQSLMDQIVLANRSLTDLD